MRVTIATKISLLAILAVACSSLVVLLTTLKLTEPMLEASLDNEIRMMKRMMGHNYFLRGKNFANMVGLMVQNRNLIRAVVEGDDATVRELAVRFMKGADADVCTITDVNGKVLARGHSDSAGDDENDQPLVRFAREGRSARGVVLSAGVAFTARAGSPIMSNGKVIGSMNLGLNLSTEDFVDSLKGEFPLEVSVFRGDTRIMTTIRGNNGQRLIGTKLDDRDILNRVLQRGETVYRNIQINGVNMEAAYWPIKDIEGQPVGMWFLGQPLTAIEKSKAETLQKVLFTFAGITAVFAGIAFFAGWLIVRPVKAITQFAVDVASGKLDAPLRVTSHDETATMAKALQSMVGTLKERIGEAAEQADLAQKETQKAHEAMRSADEAQKKAENARREGLLEAARRFTDVAVALSASSEQLSQRIAGGHDGASRQASRMTETATAMNEMAATVTEVAKNASDASELSEQTRLKAEGGAKLAQQAVEGIHEVSDTSLLLKKDMEQLASFAQSIDTVMNVISDIADQTNLLALNAAIEAARAGEAGRGFAVVAEEVRKLAEKTMASTSDVGEAITSIQNSAAKSMERMEQTVNRVEEATGLVTQSGATLQEIMIMMESTAEQVRGIATASEQQSAASEEINESITSVNGIAGDTMQAMDEATSAVAEMARQINKLNQLIESMKNS